MLMPMATLSPSLSCLAPKKGVTTSVAATTIKIVDQVNTASPRTATPIMAKNTAIVRTRIITEEVPVVAEDEVVVVVVVVVVEVVVVHQPSVISNLSEDEDYEKMSSDNVV